LSRHRPKRPNIAPEPSALTVDRVAVNARLEAFCDAVFAFALTLLIIDVRIPGIFYDSATQQRIDQYNQKVQETKNAQQDVQTATQQRLASEQRAAQAAPDLKVAIFNCIND